MDGCCARAPPAGITQEIYALLVTYQARRAALADAALARPDIRPDRLSFSVALHAARDQLVYAAATIADTTIDLIGRIGAASTSHYRPGDHARAPECQTRHLQTPSQRHPSTAPITQPPSPSKSSTVDNQPPKLTARHWDWPPRHTGTNRRPGGTCDSSDKNGGVWHG